MDYREINPFLRFVNIINFEPIREDFKACDNHFYFASEDSSVICIDGVDFEIKRGTAVIVPAGVRYYFKHEGKLRIVSINFDYTQENNCVEKILKPQRATTFDDSDLLSQPRFDNCSFLNNPLVVENVNYLKAEIDLIFREYAYKKQFYREKSSGYFKNVIFDMLRSCMWKGKGSESVNTVLDYVHGHYWEDLCNEKLAEMAGYHPYHLNRLVKSSTGITLRQYIINYRIEVAKKLLRETEMRVSEIAEACGYKNFSNFSEDFKNKAGRSPLKYRSEYRHLV